MKKFEKILAKLRTLAAEPFMMETALEPSEMVGESPDQTVDTTSVVNLGRVICTGTINGQNYSITEQDIIEATMCGEAAECGPEERMRVLAIAYNRARAKPQTVSRGQFQFSGLIAALVAESQFSCWNNNEYNSKGLQPNAFLNCNNLKERVDYLKGLCSAGSALPSIGEAETRQKLVELGFDGPTDSGAAGYEKHRDPRYVFHYSTPSVFKSQGNACLRGLDLSPGKKYEISFSEYDPLLGPGDKPMLFGNGQQKCKKRSYKSIVATDACHSFASDLDKPYRENSKSTTVPCPPGRGLRRVCDTAIIIAPPPQNPQP